MSINKSIKNGLTTATIKNAHETNLASYEQTKKTVLEPLIKDKDILNIMQKEHNFQKLGYRIEHKIRILNNENNILMTASKLGNTPQQEIEKLKKLIKRNDEITDYGEIREKLKQNKWIISQLTREGNIKRIEYKLTFRKQ